jgi:hypothetical protein
MVSDQAHTKYEQVQNYLRWAAYTCSALSNSLVLEYGLCTAFGTVANFLPKLGDVLDRIEIQSL